MEMNGKVALITGAASGIGKASALAFAAKGVKLALSDLNDKDGEALCNEIRAQGKEAVFTKLDVSQVAQVEQWVEDSVSTFGKIDFCLNSAGIDGSEIKPTADYDIAVYQKVMDINVSGLWYCMRAQLRQMMKQQSGSIVNIASVAGLLALPGMSPYVASKHAVIGLTKTAAAEYARFGIRVNAVCPSFIETPMVTQSLAQSGNKLTMEKMAAINPTKRIGQPEEVARAILFLCSEEASYINAHSLSVDGGLSVV